MEQSGRVLVVDADVDARLGSAAALRNVGYQVIEAGACSEAIGIAGRRPIDLVLLEVDLPDGDGYGLAHQLRATDDPAVVFLTAADRGDEILAGFDAGADDYISKTRPRRELLARVAAVLRRTHAAAQVWRVGDLLVDEHSGVVTRGGSVAGLTETEFRLLVIFVRHEGITLSKRQLLILVWGDDSYGCNVVERHISCMRRKLEAYGPRVIHTVRGFGYVLRRHG
jgi:two-component system OmpR family response regulator